MKKYFCKIYQPNGAYITAWNDADFSGFTKTINGGLGELTIKLARKFDDFGENNDVKLNNEVQIWLSDIDTASSGLKIYSGFISNYIPMIDGGKEYVEIKCLGYVSKLATSILKNGSQIELKTDTSAGLTTGSTASGCLIQDVVKAIIDRYQAESTNPKVNYDSSSVDTTTNTMTYTFNAKYYKEALDRCRESAPADWWWYVGEDNILQFKPKPNIRTHQFVFGKHFKKIAVEKNMENVVNRVLFSSGNNPEEQILKLYSDTTSSDSYDDRWKVITDNRVSVDGTADNIGQGTLAEQKDADVKTYIEIIDNNINSKLGYNIESIDPGDTCKLIGFNDTTSQTFLETLTIKAVQYSLDKVTLELEGQKVNIGSQLSDNDRRISEQEASGRPTTYDTSTDAYTRISMARQDNTTDSHAPYRVICSGWGQIQGNTGYPSVTEAVTFPITFDSAPLVIITNIGFKTTSATAITQFNFGASLTHVGTDAISTTGFNAFVFTTSGGNFSDTYYYGYSWIAIGQKI